METSIIIAIITVGIPGVISLYLQLKKNRVEERLSDAAIAEKISLAAGTLLDKLQKQVDDLTMEVKIMEKQVQRLKTGVNKLIDQIRARGEKPCWTPEEEDA